MLKYGAIAVFVLAAWAALDVPRMAWMYMAAVALFELWLRRRMAMEERGQVPVGEAPYRFTEEEAAFVARYRFYFAVPGLAAQAGSVLSAIGLSSAALVLWLTYRQAYAEGAILAANLFLVGWLTRRVAPMYALRLTAARGNREALRMLELLDPLWAKIHAANREP